MHYSFYSKDALLTPTFKCLCVDGISSFVFQYFWCLTVLVNLLMFGKGNKLTRTHLVKKKKQTNQLKWMCHAVG